MHMSLSGLAVVVVLTQRLAGLTHVFICPSPTMTFCANSGCGDVRVAGRSPNPSRAGRLATMGSMALIVFLRGINVGGHRAFRPSMLAKDLGTYEAVNVGAAGTLVVRKPGLRAKFLAELRRKLPFEATIALCDGRDLIRLEMDNPFGTEPPPADVVQFVSILSAAGRRGVSLQIALPEGGEW